MKPETPKNKRFLIWVYASVFSGILWGIWQGGIIPGIIYGAGVFVLFMVYEWVRSLKI